MIDELKKLKDDGLLTDVVFNEQIIEIEKQLRKKFEKQLSAREMKTQHVNINADKDKDKDKDKAKDKKDKK